MIRTMFIEGLKSMISRKDLISRMMWKNLPKNLIMMIPSKELISMIHLKIQRINLMQPHGFTYLE